MAVVEVVVLVTAVVCPVPPVSIIVIEISLFEIRRICSLNGVISLESSVTVTLTLDVPSVIDVGLKVVSATFPEL